MRRPRFVALVRTQESESAREFAALMRRVVMTSSRRGWKWAKGRAGERMAFGCPAFSVSPSPILL